MFTDENITLEEKKIKRVRNRKINFKERYISFINFVFLRKTQNHILQTKNVLVTKNKDEKHKSVFNTVSKRCQILKRDFSMISIYGLFDFSRGCDSDG
jgi:hypothetical protein